MLAGTVTLALAGCTVEKKNDAAADTALATPAPQAAVPDTTSASPVDTARKKGPTPAKSTSKKDTDNRMRDSATQPVYEIGADGKVKPVKKY